MGTAPPPDETDTSNKQRRQRVSNEQGDGQTSEGQPTETRLNTNTGAILYGTDGREAVAADGRRRDSNIQAIDKAALLGAALAAILALTIGSGPWDWVSVLVGLALLAVILTFFKFPTGVRSSRKTWQRRLRLSPHWKEAVALSLVLALAATLTLAWPFQSILTAANTTGAARCQQQKVIAEEYRIREQQSLVGNDAAVKRVAGKGQRLRDALAVDTEEFGQTTYDNCIGNETTEWLWIPAAAAAVVAFVWANLLSGRRAREWTQVGQS